MTGMMLYYDALEEYMELTDEQFGRLIRAGLVYGKDGEETELPIPERYLYPGLKLKITRDKEKYQAVCEKRAEAARKRWNQQTDGEPEVMQMDANGCKQCQYQEKEKEKKKYQYQEKEKGKLPAQQYTQRDYTGEEEEAIHRMINKARREKSG